MPDITMCDNEQCPLREKCYRFRAIPDPYWQSFAHFEPSTYPTPKGTQTECDHFWDISERPQREIKQS